MMIKKILLVVLVLLVLAVPASAQDVSRSAIVGVDDVTVSVGETFTVPVWIHGVSDLYGADVRLMFDNTILQGVKVERGTLLTPGFVVRQGFYGPPFCAGPCARYAMTQINPQPPVTGSGVFMIVHFKALRSGTVNLSLRQELATRNGVLIPATVHNATVTVVAGK